MNEPDNDLANVRAKAESYMSGVVDKSIDYYRNHSRRNNFLYNSSRVGIVVLSLTLPVIIASEKSGQLAGAAIAAAVVPVVIAILAALDGFFHWGEMWMSRTSTQLSLQRIKREFWVVWEAQQFLPIEERAKFAYEKYAALVKSVEDLLQEEEQAFWGRRIQTSKDPKN